MPGPQTTPSPSPMLQTTRSGTATTCTVAPPAVADVAIGFQPAGSTQSQIGRATSWFRVAGGFISMPGAGIGMYRTICSATMARPDTDGAALGTRNHATVPVELPLASTQILLYQVTGPTGCCWFGSWVTMNSAMVVSS